MKIDENHIEQAKSDVERRPTTYTSMVKGSAPVREEIDGIARVVCEELGVPMTGRRLRVVQGAIASAVQLGYAIHETEHEEG